MEPKSFVKSKTLWVGFTALIAGAVALVLHYTGSNVLSPELLGAAWTELFTSIAMIALRFATSQPVTINGGGGPDDKDGETKIAGLTSLTMLLCACACACMCLGGCSTLTVKAKKDIGIDVEKGPPCKVMVSADGNIVATVTGPKACKVYND